MASVRRDDSTTGKGLNAARSAGQFFISPDNSLDEDIQGMRPAAYLFRNSHPTGGSGYQWVAEYEMKVIILASVGILTTATPDAQSSTGMDIKRWCESDPAVALAYIDGIMDAYATVGPPIDYCPPRGVTYGEVRNIVCSWVNNYPEERHKADALLVSVALSRAWPCKD